MGKAKHRKAGLLQASSLWSTSPRGMTADRHLEAVLGSVTRLPLPHWKDGMFFKGFPDESAWELSGGRFPAGPIRGTHPVFSLKAQPDSVGFRVCPCSSKRPYHGETVRYVRKGCCLLHTGHIVDRNSYLVEECRFNIPRSLAAELRFLGQVPEDCIAHDRRS